MSIGSRLNVKWSPLSRCRFYLLGEKSPFSRNICKIFAVLSIRWGCGDLSPGWLFSFWRHLTPHRHKLEVVRTMRCFLLLVQPGLFRIVSSHLPAWRVQLLLLLFPVDQWIIASLLVQQSSWHPCSGRARAALPAKQAPQPREQPRAAVLFQQRFQGPHSPFNLDMQNQCLKSEIQELVLKKWVVVSVALPSTSKAAFGVIKTEGSKPGTENSSPSEWICGEIARLAGITLFCGLCCAEGGTFRGRSWYRRNAAWQ